MGGVTEAGPNEKRDKMMQCNTPTYHVKLAHVQLSQQGPGLFSIQRKSNLFYNDILSGVCFVFVFFLGEYIHSCVCSPTR